MMMMGSGETAGFLGRRLRLVTSAEGKKTEEWAFPGGAFGLKEETINVFVKTYTNLAAEIWSFGHSDFPATLAERLEEVEGFYSQINHPNICSLLHVFRRKDKRQFVFASKGNEVLRREVTPGGSTVFTAPSPKGEEMKGSFVYTGEAAREILTQLVSAVSCLHSLGIFHLDIKPANVAVASVCHHMLRRLPSSSSSACPDPEALAVEDSPEEFHKVSGCKKRKGRAPSLGLWLSEAAEDEQTQRECSVCGSRLLVTLLDLDSAQRSSNTLVSPGGTSKVAIPPEELNPIYAKRTKSEAAKATGTETKEAERETETGYSSPFVSADSVKETPARMLNLEGEEKLNGEAKDVYALGCLLAEILTGEHPYIRTTKERDWREAESLFFASLLAGETLAPQPTSYIQPSPAAYDLICGMVTPNPCQRLRLSQVLNHPWLHQTFNPES